MHATTNTKVNEDQYFLARCPGMAYLAKCLDTCGIDFTSITACHSGLEEEHYLINRRHLDSLRVWLRGSLPCTMVLGEQQKNGQRLAQLIDLENDSVIKRVGLATPAGYVEARQTGVWMYREDQNQYYVFKQ